ncbi:MAG: hypothetical protein NW237_09020 [Cyanobacteriota bacterium]|nr:hypothetical protein [Cyanobacteriota bacterium]
MAGLKILAVGLAFLILAGLGILLLPWRVMLRWRKPWGGNPVLWWQLILPVYLGVVSGQSRCWRYRWGSHSYQGILPSPQLAPLIRLVGGDPLAVWQLLRGWQPHLRHWQGEGFLEAGLGDPVLVGQWIGLIASLPLPWARRIHLTFSQTGWRSRGTVQMEVRPLLLFPAGILFLGKRWRKNQQA